MTRIICAAALLSISVPFAASANARPVEFLFSGSQNYIQGRPPAPYDAIGTSTPLSARLAFDDAAVDLCPPGLGAGTFHACPGDQTSEIGLYTGTSFSLTFGNVTIGGVPDIIEVQNDHDYLRHGSWRDQFAAYLTLPDRTHIAVSFDNDSALNGNFGPQLPFTSDALPTGINLTDWHMRYISIIPGAGGVIFGDISEVIYRVIPEPPAAILAVVGVFLFLSRPVGIRALV